MKQIVVTTRDGTPVRARVTDMETGETWTSGTTVSITRRHNWNMTPRLHIEIDSPHADAEEITIVLEKVK